jgi:hypothetical protein
MTVGGLASATKNLPDMAETPTNGMPLITVNQKPVEEMSGADTPQAIDSADNASAAHTNV